MEREKFKILKDIGEDRNECTSGRGKRVPKFNDRGETKLMYVE